MKKTLVAIAAAAAVTGAMADATISGLLDNAITTSTSATTLGDGPNGGNEIVFGVSEDLGNGIKAVGAYTIIGSMTSAAGFKTYNSFIGFEGSFGSIKTGTMWNPIFLASTISDATGRWGSTSQANPAELQNNAAITYNSPSFSGITLSAQKQMSTSSSSYTGATYYNGGTGTTWLGTGAGDSTAYSVTYAADGIQLAYANSTDTYAGDTSLVAAAVDFGVVKLHYGYKTTNFNGDTGAATSNTAANGIGISAPVGDSLRVSIMSSSNDAASKTTSTNYAAMYSLSKRTQIYLQSATTTTTSSTSSTLLGWRHALELL